MTMVIAAVCCLIGGWGLGLVSHDPILTWIHKQRGNTRVVTIRGPRRPRVAKPDSASLSV